MTLQRRSFLKLLPAIPAITSVPVFASDDSAARMVMRFIVASDGHYGQPGTEFKAMHTDLVRWINREKLQKGVDFLMLNGDLIHDDPTLLYDLKTLLAGLRVPYYVGRGNHDRVGIDVWESTWGYKPNHSFGLKDYAFVIGDTSNEKGEYVCPDIQWLKEELAKHTEKRGVFVFLHITPEKWTDNGINCKEIMDLLDNTPNVKAIFNGHDHDQDGKKQKGKKPYFFDGHFGG
ncbi:MAG TPA: metallophosphoesterase, partial [Dyadobacter sp.]|nr:metallophosphoesterase [Dyadobacter sp.]